MAVAASLFWVAPMSHLRLWICFFRVGSRIWCATNILVDSEQCREDGGSSSPGSFGWDSESKQPAKESVHAVFNRMLAVARSGR